ncbi:MAG: hypothetical protein L0G99_06185 [Propionibacteriales bacterium]|nr:hypothetical protein [Propionibacteriales bacterium]
MADPINPNAEFPTDNMHPEVIEGAATKIRKVGNSVRRTCGSVSRAWRGLPSGYDAPRDQALFAAMKPATTKAQDFKGDMDDVGRALDTFATEVRQIKREVAKIRADAREFLKGIGPGGTVEKGSRGLDRSGLSGKRKEPWDSDGEMVDANNGLISRMRAQQAALRRAELACTKKIRALYVVGALFGGGCTPTLGGGQQKIELPTGTVAPPWGQPVGKKDSIGMQIVKGFAVDGPIGFAQGFTGLVGFSWNGKGKAAGFSFATARQSWEGIGRTIAMTNPLAMTTMAVPGPVGEFARGQYKKQVQSTWGMFGIDPFAKNKFAAWEGEEPGRTMGKSMFNGVTAFTPVGKASGPALATKGVKASAAHAAASIRPHVNTPPLFWLRDDPAAFQGPKTAPYSAHSKPFDQGHGPSGTWLDKDGVYANGKPRQPFLEPSDAGSAHKNAEPNSYRKSPFGEPSASRADKESNALPQHPSEQPGRADHHPPSKKPNPASGDAPNPFGSPHQPPSKDPSAPFRMPDQIHGKDVGPLTSETNTGRPGESAPPPRRQELDPKA